MTSCGRRGNIWITSDIAGGVNGNYSERGTEAELSAVPWLCSGTRGRTAAAFSGFGLDLSGRMRYHEKRTDVHNLEVRNGD